ncbi:MAG: hypothetical protein ACOX4W_05310 [Bacilli bacterium]
MKKIEIIPIYMIWIMSILTFFITISVSYAYFDNLSTLQNETIPIGDWRGVYLTGFENYTGGTGNVNLDGKVWSITNSTYGNSFLDNYNDTRSLRMKRNSSLASVDSYKGANFISFYYGQSKYGLGSPKLTLTATINGITTVTLIDNQTIPKTFSYTEFDLSYFYTTGVNGTVFSRDSVITFRFDFTGGTFTLYDLNIDDIRIVYSPL